MKSHEIWNVTFLNQILDTMAEGLFTLDDRGVITAWNQAMEKISGYTAQEAVGRGCDLLKCSQCFGKTCPADVHQCGVMRHGKTEAKECYIRHKEGYDVPVIKNARLARDSDGQVLGIVETVTDLTELRQIRAREKAATEQLEKTYRLGNIIGSGPAMEKVFHGVRAAADSRATILIQGESGTGKELVAKAIHFNSAEAQRPLVIVNCSALSETLLESELFGHVKGAFTGAHKDRTGRFEQADTGTIFLDEIGELTPYMQVKLLRVLQEREIERVGDARKIKIDIRIIAATHKNLHDLTRQGMFREDLYYRLKVFPIHLPPLGHRKEDIPLLVTHFIRKGNQREGKKIQGITPAAMKVLTRYDWPGNVRELENAIEHAFVLCRTREIHLDHLPAEVIAGPGGAVHGPALSGRFDPLPGPPLRDPFGRSRPSLRYASPSLDKDLLLDLLAACHWNKAEVARRIGKSRTLVWKLMKKWDIPLKKP